MLRSSVPSHSDPEVKVVGDRREWSERWVTAEPNGTTATTWASHSSLTSQIANTIYVQTNPASLWSSALVLLCGSIGRLMHTWLMAIKPGVTYAGNRSYEAKHIAKIHVKLTVWNNTNKIVTVVGVRAHAHVKSNEFCLTPSIVKRTWIGQTIVNGSLVEKCPWLQVQ